LLISMKIACVGFEPTSQDSESCMLDLTTP